MSNLQIARHDDGESKEELPAARARHTQSAVGYNMFEDPAIMGIRDSVDQETLDHYAKIGEHMYKNIDFTGDDLEIMLDNRCKELVLRINNGYHPSFLDESEMQILEEKKGKELYVTFGYTEEDLNEIVNIPRDLPILKKAQLSYKL